MNGFEAVLEAPLLTLVLSAGVAWASGLRLYLLLFLLGLAGRFGFLALPAELSILRHPALIGVCASLLVVEFIIDKFPGLDSVWDAFQTFVRIPAGGALAAWFLGLSVDSPESFAAVAMLGGTLTAGTALTKAGGRLAINASPEPFSNWGASLSEDAAVLGGFWLMLQHPALFLGCLALFVLLMIVLLPKLWRFMGGVFRMLLVFLGFGSGRAAPRV